MPANSFGPKVSLQYNVTAFGSRMNASIRFDSMRSVQGLIGNADPNSFPSPSVGLHGSRLKKFLLQDGQSSEAVIVWREGPSETKQNRPRAEVSDFGTNERSGWIAVAIISSQDRRPAALYVQPTIDDIEQLESEMTTKDLLWQDCVT
jgi:hypothetical protein